jgi:hypothetical protein
MKVTIVFALVLLCFALVMSSTCLEWSIEPQCVGGQVNSRSQGSLTAVGNSSTSDNVESELGRQAGLSADQSDGCSNSNETVSDGLVAETPVNGDTSDVPGNRVAPSDASPPDGRIYLGGEPPFAYTPTYSPKQKGLPTIPLTPDD